MAVQSVLIAQHDEGTAIVQRGEAFFLVMPDGAKEERSEEWVLAATTQVQGGFRLVPPLPPRPNVLLHRGGAP